MLRCIRPLLGAPFSSIFSLYVNLICYFGFTTISILMTIKVHLQPRQPVACASDTCILLLTWHFSLNSLCLSPVYFVQNINLHYKLMLFFLTFPICSIVQIKESRNFLHSPVLSYLCFSSSSQQVLLVLPLKFSEIPFIFTSRFLFLLCGRLDILKTLLCKIPRSVG